MFSLLTAAMDGALGGVRKWNHAVTGPKNGRYNERLIFLVDIGVWMRADVLADKLEAQDERNPEQAWNMGRWPQGLSTKGEHRLFVASGGVWCGYFKLSGEALFNPDDVRAPYALLFDTRTWTQIPPTPVKRFREIGRASCRERV